MSTTSFKTRKAFTLLELLIVVAGIGALMTVVIVMNTGATEGARSAKCKSHMRNLAQAVQSYAMSHGAYPSAGSYQYSSQTMKGLEYRAEKGWIGWNELARGKYPTNASGTKPSSSWNESCLNNKNDTLSGAYFAVTNGVLWPLVHDIESYVCPEHRRLCRKNNGEPLWSYAMNAYFGYDHTWGAGSAKRGICPSYPDDGWSAPWGYGHLKHQTIERTLLFAEIPAVDVGGGDVFVKPTSSGGDHYTDCTLQFYTDTKTRDPSYPDDSKRRRCRTWEWKHTPEVIGFNHKSGKNRVAHVVFADSHVEELVLPSNPSVDSLQKLTANLCNGIQLTYTNGQYLDPDGKTN